MLKYDKIIDSLMTEESGKMPKYLVTEEEVKKALDIDSFRNMSKSKIMDFISFLLELCYLVPNHL